MLSLSNLTSSTGASVYFELDDYYTKDEAQAELIRTTSFQGEIAKELNLPNHIDKETFKDLLDGIIRNYGKIVKGKNNENIDQNNKENTDQKDNNLATVSNNHSSHNHKIIQKLGRIILNTEKTKEQQTEVLETTKTTELPNKTAFKERYAGLDMTFSAPKSLSILSEVLGKEELSKIHDEAVKTTLSYAEANLIQTRIRTGSAKSVNSTVDYKQTKKLCLLPFVIIPPET